MRFLSIFILLMLPMAAYAAAEGGDGAAKSAICSVCHGVSGVSDNDLYPNLAGQNSAYIAKQLRAFKSGERIDPIMAPMATALSDADIQILADYYSALK